MEAAREDAAGQLEQRRVELPSTEEIKGYVADFREFLQEGTFPERKALIRNFVEGIEVTGDEAVLTYTIPMPNDRVTQESASFLISSSPAHLTRLEPVLSPNVATRCTNCARLAMADSCLGFSQCILVLSLFLVLNR